VKQYAYLIRPAFDQAFMASAGEREQAVVEAHWQFLLDLHRRGRLVFAGRCFNGPFGIIVFEAGGDDEAAAIADSDPSVLAGVQQAELHPFKVGLLRGEEPA
jgi:uncharacterized protein